MRRQVGDSVKLGLLEWQVADSDAAQKTSAFEGPCWGLEAVFRTRRVDDRHRCFFPVDMSLVPGPRASDQRLAREGAVISNHRPPP